MCIILSINHTSCSHTLAIWHHCVNATSSQGKSCLNARQHERPILTRKLCEACSGQRIFARRGGVAGQGNGTLTTIAEADAKLEGDEANDSGYHSDIIYEQDEGSNPSERSLSPKTIAPQRASSKTAGPRKRNSSRQRSLNRKPSWRPNLKRDLSLAEQPPQLSRRDSIDSRLSLPDENTQSTSNVQSFIMNTTPSPKSSQPATRQPNAHRARTSTLLHPSPPEPITGQAQVAVVFSSPQIIEIRRPTSLQPTPRPRKKSTLLHPSSPDREPSTEHKKERRPSSLLHPSPSAPATTTVFPKTIISVPPQHAPVPRLGRTSSLLHATTTPEQIFKRMPPLKSAVSEPQSQTMATQRRESVLHSCLSDEEDVEENRRGRRM